MNPKRWVITQSAACRAELHELCGLVECDCECHDTEEDEQ